MDKLKNDLMDADPFKTWWPFIIAGFVGLVMAIRFYMGGQLCPNNNLLNKRIVIITGGNCGIGLEITKELGKRGGIIIIATRNISKAENQINFLKKLTFYKNLTVIIKYMDLRSFDCIRRFVKVIETEYEKVDILINNAGIIFNPYEKTVDGFETHLQTNYLGHFLLTVLLLPMIKKSQQGRIINISAHAHSSNSLKMNIDDPLNINPDTGRLHPRDAFSHSKLAIVIATKLLADIIKDTGITINCCTPGLVRGTEHLRESPIMKAICAKFVTYPWMWIFMKSPEQGAQTAIYLATEQENIKNITGKYFNDCEVADTSNLCNNDEYCKKLLAETLKCLKLNINDIVN